MTPEGKIKAKVNRMLAPYIERGDIWKFMPVQMGMGAPALDFLLCVKGHFFAIETKVLGKHLTPRQKITKAEMMKAGATVSVVDDDQSLAVAHTEIEFLIKFGEPK